MKTIFYLKGVPLFRSIWKALETHFQRAGLLEPRPMSSRVKEHLSIEDKFSPVCSEETESPQSWSRPSAA